MFTIYLIGFFITSFFLGYILGKETGKHEELNRINKTLKK